MGFFEVHKLSFMCILSISILSQAVGQSLVLDDSIADIPPHMIERIHGNLHDPARYSIGDTEIICNPHGYINEVYNGFNNSFIIEL
ncbi:hypothetical protein QE382_002266 [Sphingobacterium zeae]|uniref:Uncharacterized protein n=1 Tax=Sphingobacterium zeae TaxID=1776859 RepID=A0ABU0U5Q5_9SPHI|nr:hypothetical protein [Sphingobacterium zeae]